ncbi:MAG: phytanoyl-CoA dioxygenase family protein [Candidatus Poribacteria bacterium]|nr:phytanoyl-CoA dioxygenase family protein [Candidatus Poribacteria bacterium]
MAYKELTTKKPFVVNKNLGSAVEVEPEELTSTNAEGLPVVIPTQKQKYDFDRKGWLLIPNILSEAEIEEMRDFCYQLKNEPDSIPEQERCGLGGPLQKLVDHPTVVGLLNEFLAYPPAASEDCYGFRLEESDIIFGAAQSDKYSQSSNNKGNGLFRLPGDSHIYRCVPGRGWSGLTRAIWEFSEVNVETNCFRFITGSHKSAYPVPNVIIDDNSPIWETYECLPGSLFLITESITQMNLQDTPQSGKNNRTRISNLYNTVASRWSNWLPHPKLIEAMQPKRQTLFREVYAGGNVINGDFGNRTSAYSIEK